ncbi:MAG TPA: ABC transporter permease, partial [Candidatus Acidoferrum sp.]|nr:ABC transporter permease [Candidatus Acidoferrum sp.]
FLGDLTVPYPLYAILGMAFWQVFATGVVGGSHSLVNAGSMLTQINFSRKSLVVASVAQSLVSFLVQFLLVVALLVYYGLPPSPAIFAVPVFLIPLLALTLGLALLLSLLNGIFRDIMNVLSIFITFLMFLTPVLYAQTHTGILGEITRYNPLHYLISGAREMVLSGSVSDPLGYSLTSALSLVFLWISLLAFHLTESRIAERA